MMATSLETTEQETVLGVIEKAKAIAPKWLKSHNGRVLSVEVVGNGEYLPCIKQANDLLWAGGLFKSIDTAKSALIEQYNAEYNRLQPGYQVIDVDLIYSHPKNSAIYVGDSFEDLVKLIDVEEPYIAALEITSTGRIISGNRRKKSIDIVNNLHSPVRKVEAVSAIVSEALEEEEELEQLILNNQTREKTLYVKGLEAKFLLEIEKIKSTKRKGASKAGTFKDEEITGKSTGIVGEVTAIGSASRTENVIAAVDVIAHESNPVLAGKLRQVLDKTNPIVLKAIASQPPALREELCDKVLESGKKRINVQTLAGEIGDRIIREKAALHLQSGAVQTEDKFETAASLRDKFGGKDEPADNRFTPQILIDAALSVFDGVMNCDPFTPYVDDTKPTPALIQYTIKEDGFTRPWNGKVFSNFPFSKQSRCFEKLNDEIESGRTTEAIIIAEAGAIFAKGSQSVIASRDMMICLLRGRVEFMAGDLLLRSKQGESVDSSNRSNTVVVYYGENREAFYNAFSKFGDTRFTYNDLAGFTQATEEVISAAVSLSEGDKITVPKWVHNADKTRYSAMINGLPISIKLNADLNTWSATYNIDTVAAGIADVPRAKAIAIGYALAIIE